MRIYKDSFEAIREVERDLMEMGIVYQSTTCQDQDVSQDKGFLTKELSPYSYSVTKPVDKLEEMLSYKKDQQYINWVKAESMERYHGVCTETNPGDAWKLLPELWSQFNHDGFFAYTYVERIQEQLKYVRAELKRNPASRQVMITMYDRHQDMMNWGGKARVPCSLNYNFLIRNNKLTLTYTQRSCDFYNFFHADVYCAIYMQEQVAKELGLEVGKFTHFIISLHAFKKDMKEVF